MADIPRDALAWAEQQVGLRGPYLSPEREAAFRRRVLADPDAATGCADDQTFAVVPTDLLRRIADA